MDRHSKRPTRSAEKPASRSEKRKVARVAPKRGAKRGAKPPRPSRASSEEPRGAGAHWSLAEAVALLAFVFLAFVVKDVVLSLEVVRVMPQGGMIITRMVVLTLFYLAFIAMVALLARRRGLGVWESVGLGRLKTPLLAKLGGALIVLTLLVGTRAVSIAYLLVVRAIGWDPPAGLDVALTELFGSGAAGLVAAIALVVVLGPLVEEVVFRGVVQRSLVPHLGAWGAIGLSAALFAAYHFTLWLALPTFVLGIAVGWLAHERPGLWSAVVLHGLYNAAAVAVAYWLEMAV